MNVNDKLTTAARDAAHNVTRNAYQRLPKDRQKAMLDHILADKMMTEEIVRSTLNALPDAEVDALDSFDTTSL